MAARKIAMSTLNASNVDILNTIRDNLGYDYQTAVPEVLNQDMVPKVGEIIFGYPAIANMVVNALMNRIALVTIRSAMYNNPYKNLKKGYLDFGATVEEAFVDLVKARVFSPEKAEERELKRTPADIKSTFHTINYRVQYPITVDYYELREAFLTEYGLSDLINKILDAPYRSSEYDEYLLFKYLLIKGRRESASFQYTGDTNAAAVAFRSLSNGLTFMTSNYNSQHVRTVTPRDDQHIFMDTNFNAKFDVESLSSAFNMDKVNYLGRLNLIDSFNTFDSERFSNLIDEGVMADLTQDELNAMNSVKAIIADREWFQVYDTHINMTEKQVAAGEYWNYFLNIAKIVSYSPFSNIVYIEDGTTPATPGALNFKIASKVISGENTILTFEPTAEVPGGYMFTQTSDLTDKTIAVHPYGAVIVPPSGAGENTYTVTYNDSTYNSPAVDASTATVGEEIAFTKV